MESSLKIALGIVAAALVIGLLGMPAIAQAGFGGSGMMGSGFGGMMGSGKGGMMGSAGGFGNMMGSGLGGSGMMGSAGSGMMGGAGDGTCGMHESVNDTGGCGMMGGNFDMNAMHKAMHGEDADVDMNQMHARMLAGNLTQEDWKEMREHCPMMRGKGNATE